MPLFGIVTIGRGLDMSLDRPAWSSINPAAKQIRSNIRTARSRRNMTIEDVASRVGVHRETVSLAEKGNPTFSSTPISAPWVFGLLADLASVADPDNDVVGKTLAADDSRERARSCKGMSNDFLAAAAFTSFCGTPPIRSSPGVTKWPTGAGCVAARRLLTRPAQAAPLGKDEIEPKFGPVAGVTQKLRVEMGLCQQVVAPSLVG